MPAFERLARREGHRSSFRGYRVFALQHVLGSTGALLETLVAQGARRQDVVVSGKMYSEHPEVSRALSDAGYDVLSSHGNADVHVALRIIEASRADPHRPLLVIDDGGHVLGYLKDAMRLGLAPPHLAHQLVAVEQTRRGRTVLENTALLYGDGMSGPTFGSIPPHAELAMALAEPARQGEVARALLRGTDDRSVPFPVVFMGDAWAKERYEAPMIGRSVALAVTANLRTVAARWNHPTHQLPPRETQILVAGGAGTIGQPTVHELLRQGYQVAVADPRFAENPRLRRRMERQGVRVFEGVEDAISATSPVVYLSVAGRRTLDDAAAEMLPAGAILMNGASFRSDFDFSHLSPPGGVGGDPHNPFTVSSGYADQQHIAVQFRRGSRVLARGGNPINFGSVDPIPPSYSQLIRGLIYLSAVRATEVAGQRPGFYSLARRPQQRFVADVNASLRRAGAGSLERPTFSHPEGDVVVQQHLNTSAVH